MSILRGIVILTCVLSAARALPQISKKVSGKDKHEDIHQVAKYLDVSYILGNHSCQCGKPVSRIAGEEDVDTHQYPWVAIFTAVESETLKIPYCGGALINNLYVLTASHCVDGMNVSKIEVVLREENMKIKETWRNQGVSGNHNGGPPIMKNPLGAIRIGVASYIQHPNYSRRTLDNDIALVRLKVRVPMINFPVAPICVPENEARFSQGVIATIAGYGATSETREGPQHGNLEMTQVRVLSNALCNNAHYHRGKITENMLCADENGKGPCTGDTGGPLMVQSSKDSSRLVLAGIASWSTSCSDPTRPAVYTRVSRYQSWIQKHTQDALWCEN